MQALFSEAIVFICCAKQWMSSTKNQSLWYTIIFDKRVPALI